jgi:hypothetical protein
MPTLILIQFLLDKIIGIDRIMRTVKGRFNGLKSPQM